MTTKELRLKYQSVNLAPRPKSHGLMVIILRDNRHISPPLPARGFQSDWVNSGQLLFEVLLSAGLAAIMITAGIFLIAPVLQANKEASRARGSAVLAQELLDNVRVLSQSNWHAIADLATSSLNKYYLVTSTTVFATSTGSETTAINGTTYTRYFYFDDVRRDSTTGLITTSLSGSQIDPSIKKLTVIAGWPGGATTTLAYYLTRSTNAIWLQTDWSGGGNVADPVSGTTNQFATSVSIDFTTTTGSIILNL